MPNLKNAKKKVKVIEKKKELNNDYNKSMRTAVKNVLKAVKNNDKELSTTNLDLAIKRIDKAVKVGVIHSNKGARDKSRLTKKVNTL